MDAMEKEMEENMAEYDKEIQLWTSREVELQEQVAKLDTSPSISSPMPPHHPSSCAQPDLIH
eukprot:3841405-Karenia_brevis.AAC.1